jgi:hypothetical protein
MENRDVVYDELAFIVKNDWGREFTWKEIVETKGVLPTDMFRRFKWENVLVSGGGWLDDSPEEYAERLHVVVGREREETDEEYFKRKKEEHKKKDKLEEEEKLEYLRLKAKFEK